MKIHTWTIVFSLLTSASASAALSPPDTVQASFTVVAPLDAVSVTYTGDNIGGGLWNDETKIGLFTATKITKNQPSGIAVRWTTATGSSSDDWRHELIGKNAANKIKVYIDGEVSRVESLGQDRWVDYPAPIMPSEYTEFFIRLDGEQTLVPDTYAISLDAASYVR